jgi:hypothetical protein
VRYLLVPLALVSGALSLWLIAMSLSHWTDESSSQGFSMAAMTAIIAAASIKQFRKGPSQPRKSTGIDWSKF